MSIWALSDPHLAFAVPGKTMEAFGPLWENYTDKIAGNWRKLIKEEDLVLIPGDISWAMHLKEALVDLEWIHALPGTKVILKGNHDHWWGSSKKLTEALPSSIHFIQNNIFNWNSVTIGGARLWDTAEYTFDAYIEFRENPKARIKTPEQRAKEKEDEERLFQRELERLKLSLSQLDKTATTRIALTHYPPIGPDLHPSRASAILEENKIDLCVFGHLHSVRANTLPFGSARGVKYLFTSCDYLNFVPLKVM
ncbi:MAG: metallophosphoesterase [Rhabdochlamydiaceae bacterium]|nr:metallophosphoesterase [Rhabdochlamydiaceae bacterium]